MTTRGNIPDRITHNNRRFVLHDTYDTLDELKSDRASIKENYYTLKLQHVSGKYFLMKSKKNG